MNSEHTPGPWMHNTTATPDYAKQYAVYPEATGQTVALVYDGEEAEANARLIAAAPELLELAEYIDVEVPHWESCPRAHHGMAECLCIRSKASALLARINGED